MAQIIVTGELQATNALIINDLSSRLRIDPIERHDADETVALLAILPSISVVISPIDQASLIYQFLQKEQRETILITYGDGNKIENVSHFSGAQDYVEITSLVAKILKIDDSKFKLEEYTAFPVKHFLYIDAIPFDVYIRIKKTENNFQFIKRINAGDKLTKDFILKYLSSGLDNFYIRSINKQQTSTLISNGLINKLENCNWKEQSSSIELLANSFEISINEIKRLGLTNSTIQLTDTIVSVMTESAKQIEILNPFFKNIINSHSSYFYQHAHIICLILKEIKNAMPSNIISDEDFIALSYAAFFHDIELVSEDIEISDKLAQIENSNDINYKELSKDQKSLVNTHAAKAYNRLLSFNEINPKTKIVIREHNGNLDGNSLERTEISKVSFLSLSFIVAESFANHLLLYKKRQNESVQTPPSVLSMLKNDFPDGQANKIVKALEEQLSNRSQ